MCCKLFKDVMNSDSILFRVEQHLSVIVARTGYSYKSTSRWVLTETILGFEVATQAMRVQDTGGLLTYDMVVLS